MVPLYICTAHFGEIASTPYIGLSDFFKWQNEQQATMLIS